MAYACYIPTKVVLIDPHFEESTISCVNPSRGQRRVLAHLKVRDSVRPRPQPITDEQRFNKQKGNKDGFRGGACMHAMPD